MPASLRDPTVSAALDVRPAARTVGGRRIVTPFPSPADWRDLWIYFLLVDRFDNPGAPPRFPPYDKKELRYQGGTFQGILQRLPYLKRLGAGALWISPVLKNPPSFGDFYGGYATLDFLNVEPRFCSTAAALASPESGDQEFRELVDAAHAEGLYVILDIVLNHTGDLFNYEGMRDDAPWRGQGPEYRIFWRDETGTPRGDWPDIGAIPGVPRDAGVWPRELQRNDFFRRRGGGPDSPETEGDFGRLKELVTEYLDPATGIYPLRDHLIRAYQYLIARFDLDGYRIDTLKYVEADFARSFGNAMREFALSIGKRNFFTFGEVWEEEDRKIIEFIGRDTEKDGEMVGVDAALDFPVFRRLTDVCKGRLPPRDLADFYDLRKSVQRSVVSSHGDASRFFVTFLENHDLDDRFYWRDPAGAFDRQATLAMGCLFTLQGIPCLYYGAEQGLSGYGGPREAVREALWGKPGAFDEAHPFYKVVRDLSRLRDEHPALRYGRQYFRPLSGDGINFGYSPYAPGVLAFSRILNDREVLVVANAHTQERAVPYVLVDRQLNPDGRSLRVAFSNQPAPVAPAPVAIRAGNATTQVTLDPMEIQVLV